MAMQLLGALGAGALTVLVGIEAAFAFACVPTIVVGLCTWRLLKPEPAVEHAALPVAA
jgi:hypothetical protein